MIDSVLKGTGNSRFLKSAVPAGTSWADALAMLQAGTFPIDFNGINTEGFQQVGTPLNKANLLKDATAAQIGLPPSTTPDGMFQALGNTGELHVWRKTVVTKEPIPEVPGSYTLGSAAITNLARMVSNGYNGYAANILVSKEIKVNLDGSVELVSPTSRQMTVAGSSERYTIDVNSDELLGAGNRYFTPSKDSESNSSRCTLLIPPGTVYYVAPGTTYTTAMRSIGFTSAFNAAQLVTGVPGTPAIPAGTTTTYPVSTNPNAYQEGDDAKAAGYTLGEVETGKFKMSASPTSNTFYVNSAIAVTDAGNITFPEGYHFISIGQNSSSVTSAQDVIGNFMSLYQNKYDGNFEVGDVWFIPSDATITDYVYVTKRQRVTGYAAIPAGTTIEYLGKLGDKARVQFGSYVGTGTYGSSNPNTLTFDFVPKMVFVWGFGNSSGNSLYYQFMFYGENYTSVYIGDGDNRSTKVSWDSKTVSWYTGDRYTQLNESSRTYRFFAIC